MRDKAGKWTRAGVAVCLLAAGLFLATAGRAAALAEQERHETLMNMPVAVTVWAADDEAAAKAVGQAFDELRRVEQVFSAYRQGSDVNRINQEAGRSPVRVGAETLRVLQWAKKISEATEGAFDVTVGGFAWEYGFGQGDYRVPSQARLDQIRKTVNYRYLMLDPDGPAVLFKRDGVQIDLGGIAKTHALNSVREVLRRAGVSAALVNLGGDVTVLGKRPGGGPWRVGIRHPRDAKRLLTEVPLEAGKVLSSGDYERFFERDAVRYHHVIDPATGKPENRVIAATLFLPEHPRLDLPSVVLMLLPPAKSLALVATIPGAECLIVDADRKLWMSPGWEKTLSIKPAP